MSKIQAMFHARGRRMFDSERADAEAFNQKFATPKEKTMNDQDKPLICVAPTPMDRTRDDNLRHLALKYALEKKMAGSTSCETVADAQDFYDFLTGKEQTDGITIDLSADFTPPPDETTHKFYTMQASKEAIMAAGKEALRREYEAKHAAPHVQD